MTDQPIQAPVEMTGRPPVPPAADARLQQLRDMLEETEREQHRCHERLIQSDAGSLGLLGQLQNCIARHLNAIVGGALIGDTTELAGLAAKIQRELDTRNGLIRQHGVLEDLRDAAF